MEVHFAGFQDKGAQPADEYKQEVLRGSEAQFLRRRAVEKRTRHPSQSAESRTLNGTSTHRRPPGVISTIRRFERRKSCVMFCHHDTAVLPGSEPAIPSLFGRARPDGGQLGRRGPDGGASCRIPTVAQKEVKWYWYTLLGVAIITAFLALIAFYLTIRYLIIRPLRHLREVSDSISRGNTAQRANLRTGDEFESLRRGLQPHASPPGHGSQDEFRQVNSDLDGKVDELAQVNMQLYEMNRIKSHFLATIPRE